MGTFHLRHLRGKEALKQFLDGLREGYAGLACNSFVVHTNAIDQHLKMDGVGVDDLAQHPNVKAFAAILDTQEYLQCRVIHATFKANASVQYQTNDYVTAVLEIQPGGSGSESDKAQRVTEAASALYKHFKFAHRPDLLIELLPAVQKESLKYYEVALGDLMAAIAKIGTEVTAQVDANQRTLSQKLSELDALHTKKSEALEAEYQSKKQSLDKRDEEFKEKQKTFDTQTRMIARRELRDKLHKAIEDQASVNVTAETEDKRKVIHKICVPVIIGFAVLLATSVFTLLWRKELHWFNFTAVTICAIGLAGTLVFYLRFNNQWFSELARAEFANRKLKLDVLRANWIAELFLESKASEKIDLPDSLLISFAQNLFTDFDWSHRVQHPADQMLDMLGKTKKLKISPQGGVHLEQSETGT